MIRAQRFAQLLIAALFIQGCTVTKSLQPFEQTITRSKVEMTYTVTKSSNSIEVSTSDPIALRTFIMQGFSLSVEGLYSFTVMIPSARDVESAISHHPGEVRATMQGNEEKRPDIRPVLEALNKVEAPIFSEAGKKVGKAKEFSVSIIPQTGLLTYKISLPQNYSMDMPVNVTLSSAPADERNEFNPEQFADRNESDHRQPFGVGQPHRPNDGQREITITYQFS